VIKLYTTEILKEKKIEMNDMPVYKSIQLVATSEKNWADAVRAGYEEAKKTLRGIRNIQIVESDVKVKEDQDKLIYRVRMQVNFQIER
jgi:flavin-binding protein dodecin